MKVVGPDGALEQDARLHGERSSDHYEGGTKRGGGGVLGDTRAYARAHAHLAKIHYSRRVYESAIVPD